jgi:hypothetical protein
METTPESPAPSTPAPSTEELAELEAEFARLETELAARDDADAGDAGESPEPAGSSDGGDG